MLAAPLLPNRRDGDQHDSDKMPSFQPFPTPHSNIRQCGCARHTLQPKSAWLGKALDRHKKNPGSPRCRGLYRLLPQLVGSCDPGGEVSGDGGPPGLAY